MSKTIKKAFIGINGEAYELKLNNLYDIQTVNIQPGDTILFHINDDVDLYSVSALMEEMSKTFPQNVIIPVNEWILKGMTVIRQAKPVADMVDMSIIDRPLEEEYPELFRNDYWYWQGGSKK